MTLLWQSWLVLGEMAPYLLFGFAMAGVLSVLVSPQWTERHLGGRGFWPVVKAALWGVPLPLCSCSAIPVVASMRRHGASRAAATAFLLSTPQTGIDSITVTYALLGPVFALFRPIAALLSGLVGGAFVLLLGEGNSSGLPAGAEQPPCAESCCTADGPRNPALRAVRYGFVTLPRDLAGALLLGVLVAGAMAALMPPHRLEVYLGGGAVSILLMMAVGIPLYVCATASVPIAVGLMHLGASPGAALAFLIAGPATNPATFTTIWKVLGRRTALLYLLTVALSAALSGLALDALTPWVQGWVPPLVDYTAHPDSHGWWPHACAAVLLAVLVASFPLARRLRRATAPTEDEAAPCCCHAASQGGVAKGDRPIFGETQIGTVPSVPSPEPPAKPCGHCHP